MKLFKNLICCAFGGDISTSDSVKMSSKYKNDRNNKIFSLRQAGMFLRMHFTVKIESS